jgi:hypothetical protein
VPKEKSERIEEKRQSNSGNKNESKTDDVHLDCAVRSARDWPNGGVYCIDSVSEFSER